MRSKLLTMVMLALLTNGVLALVEPDETGGELPPWYVEIFYEDSQTMELTPFCKGSLVDPRWVLSAQSCDFDPFRILEERRASPDPEQLYARVGGSEEYVPVSKRVTAGDYSMILLKLEHAVDAEVIRLSDKLPGDLHGEMVSIYSNAVSERVSHSIFNPGSGPEMSCRTGGAEFFNDGIVCYILSPITKEATLYETVMEVVDPVESGLPGSGGYSGAGTRFYVAKESGSYPCYEDLGAPVVQKMEDGSIELVGVVTRVGIVTTVPLCGAALLPDYYASAAYYSEFIEKTKAAEFFDGQCPPSPQPAFEYVADGRARVHWPKVDGATGYQLHYTERLGYEPIKSQSVQGTEVMLDLESDREYQVSVSAFNARCSSGLSSVQVLFGPTSF